MKTVSVPLKTKPYKITIGSGILKRLGPKLRSMKIGTDALIITNPAIRKHHGKQLVDGLKRSGFRVKVFEVPPGERSKSAKQAFRLIEAIARYDVLKKPFVVAFGGGVIGDLVGYVAAAYKRGIPYVQVPTTLLAQVDSAIGGKVGIDLSVGKNLVGAFYQPKLVWSDVAVLSTLDRRQVRNGLAEVVKYGIIADARFFKYVETNVARLLACDPRALTHVVGRSSRIKADVVVADEFDTRGVRAKLNFGHTLGHAIEAAGGYRAYHHGESIALGMRAAADLSLRKKLCSGISVGRINVLLTAVGLPQKLRKLKSGAVLRHMQHDKKFLAGKNRFVLMTGIGHVKLYENIPSGMIKKALQSCR